VLSRAAAGLSPAGGPGDPDLDPGRVWSIAYFFVARSVRGHGLMRHLLDGAIAYARRQGAAVVEAYPVDPDSPSYRFMGFVPAFESAGFREVGRAGIRRHVMRLELDTQDQT
jgi:GNAT superfamily N-acetyltransferase